MLRGGAYDVDQQRTLERGKTYLFWIDMHFADCHECG
jgi:hypothetical protein